MTRLVLNFFDAILPLLKKYVLLFQKKEPSVHLLHDEQMKLFKSFLSCFIKPEVIPNDSRLLVSTDIVVSQNLLKKDDWFLGTKTRTLLTSCKDQLKDSFLKDAKEAFMTCGQYLQHKMPIDKNTLKIMSSIDPRARGHSVSQSYMLQLPELLPTVISDIQKDECDLEVRRYHSLDTLPSFGKNDRIDEWWSSHSSRTNFPVLSKAVLALLSCFHGPQVESSFSVMGDIIDTQSSRMQIRTMNSIQTIKYGLKSAGKDAIQYFNRQDIVFDPVCPKLSNNCRTAWKKHQDEQAKNREELDMKKSVLAIKNDTVISKQKAKQLAIKAAKTARKEHRVTLLHTLAKRRKTDIK